MKIKVTHPIRIAEGVYHPGSVIDVGKKEAAYYVDKHWAIYVDPPAVEKVEAATEAPKKERKHGNRKNHK